MRALQSILRHSKSFARRIARAELFAIAIGFSALASPLHADAQSGDRPQPPVIDLGEDFVIEGHVQKPEAFYFLRRTPFGFVIRTLDEDFLGEVVRAVTSEPF